MLNVFSLCNQFPELSNLSDLRLCTLKNTKVLFCYCLYPFSCYLVPWTVVTFSIFFSSSCVFSKVLECGEEKILTLTEVERFKALAAQFVKLLRSQKDNCLMMTDLLTEYTKTFGYTFRLQDYDVSSVSALTQKLCHVVKVNVWRRDRCGDVHVCVRISVFTRHASYCFTGCFVCRYYLMR